MSTLWTTLRSPLCLSPPCLSPQCCRCCCSGLPALRWWPADRLRGETLSSLGYVSVELKLRHYPATAGVDTPCTPTLDFGVAVTPRPAMLRVVAPHELRLVDGAGSEYAIHPLWLRERCRDATSMDMKT